MDNITPLLPKELRDAFKRIKENAPTPDELVAAVQYLGAESEVRCHVEQVMRKIADGEPAMSIHGPLIEKLQIEKVGLRSQMRDQMRTYVTCVDMLLEHVFCWGDEQEQALRVIDAAVAILQAKLKDTALTQYVEYSNAVKNKA